MKDLQMQYTDPEFEIHHNPREVDLEWTRAYRNFQELERAWDREIQAGGDPAEVED